MNLDICKYYYRILYAFESIRAQYINNLHMENTFSLS